MLREERKVRQIPGDLKRRWFTGRLFDLIVWYTPKGMICGFQFCYREGTDEKACMSHGQMVMGWSWGQT